MDNKVDVPVDDKDVVKSDAKPSVSYIGLIAKAILESAEKRLNLGSIYAWMEHGYPYFKSCPRGWRNSVRHNLSLNDCFIKAGRCEDGKGNYWTIHPHNLNDFIRGDFRLQRRNRRRRKKPTDDPSDGGAIVNSNVQFYGGESFLSSLSTHDGKAYSSAFSSGLESNPEGYLSMYSPHQVQQNFASNNSYSQLQNNYPSTTPSYYSAVQSLSQLNNSASTTPYEYCPDCCFGNGATVPNQTCPNTAPYWYNAYNSKYQQYQSYGHHTTPTYW